jgi:hypothetical protein
MRLRIYHTLGPIVGSLIWSTLKSVEMCSTFSEIMVLIDEVVSSGTYYLVFC